MAGTEVKSKQDTSQIRLLPELNVFLWSEPAWWWAACRGRWCHYPPKSAPGAVQLLVNYLCCRSCSQNCMSSCSRSLRGGGQGVGETVPLSSDTCPELSISLSATFTTGVVWRRFSLNSRDRFLAVRLCTCIQTLTLTSTFMIATVFNHTVETH